MSDAKPPQPTSLLQEAVQLHQRGKLDAARALYRQVLEAAPRQFDALHLLGVVARQQGQAQQAVDLILQALEVEPAHAGAYCNLGAALQDLGRSQDALASYDRAVALDGHYALAYCNRGNALRKLGRLAEALASYERALAIRSPYPEASCNRAMLLNDLGQGAAALASAEQALAARPAYADAWCARGNALQGLGRCAEALESYDRALALQPASAEIHCARGTALKRLDEPEAALCSYGRAIELRPGYATAHQYRANVLRALGRREEAIAAYRRALELGGDAGQIGFALAALGAAEAPPASPPAYVKELFDQYAGHFERHLVEVLEYRTPALLGAALQRTLAPSNADTLDLGCGTGLFGPWLRAMSRTLAGVDLSPRMLDKARERGLYDSLECADIVDYLAGGPAHAWDLVAAADVFVYFGDLAGVFAQVRRALRPGGGFCFSVEAWEEDAQLDYTLLASNRYAHSLDYLRRVAEATGFELVDLTRERLRNEKDGQVMGYLVVLRSPGSA
jgi:predicted TPR repeat methyltransferase